MTAMLQKIADRLGLGDHQVDSLLDWAEQIAPRNAVQVAETELRNFAITGTTQVPGLA